MRYMLLIIVAFLIGSCGNHAFKKDQTFKLKYDDFKTIAFNNDYLNVSICDTVHSFPVDSAINILRIANTIQVYALEQRDSLFSNITYLFSKCYFNRLVDLLKMELSIGMSYYSKEYNLSLGAYPSDASSYYQIDTLSLPQFNIQMKIRK